MARAGSAGPAMSGRARGSDPRSVSGAGEVSRSWFDVEPSLWRVGIKSLARLGRRSRATWPWLVGAAVLLAGVVLAVQLAAPPRYEVTTVLRVSEGQIEPSGTNLSGQVLRAHVQDIAFTTEHLLGIVRNHPELYPTSQDPMLGLQ